jgi:ABC-type nitrate/sulfonate/bicarbonate transport system permease component
MSNSVVGSDEHGLPGEESPAPAEGLLPERHAPRSRRRDSRKQESFWLRHPNSIRVTSVAVFLIAWQIYGSHQDPIFLPTPTAVAKAFWELSTNGDLLTAMRQSLTGFVIGFSISVVGGIVLGVLIGRSRVFYYAADPFVTALYNTTSVALIPLIMLWFGLGIEAKIVIVVLSALFPVLYNTSAGVSDVSKELTDVVRAYGGTNRDVTLKVVLPNAVPFIMSGVRLAVGQAVVAIVVAEFFTALSGLGGMIVRFSNSFQTDMLFVPVLVLIMLGIFLTELAKYIERKIAPWKVTQTARQH